MLARAKNVSFHLRPGWIFRSSVISASSRSGSDRNDEGRISSAFGLRSRNDNGIRKNADLRSKDNRGRLSLLEFFQY
jgi:hypothetical protein